MIDPVKILEERIRHEIDMDILRQLGEEAGVDLSKEIELTEKKFNNEVERKIFYGTNEKVHGKDNL